MAKRKKNYLNNKDMLKEIHLSKISYCAFRDRDNDHQQDIIVDSTDEIFGTRKVSVGKDKNGNTIYKDVPIIELAKQARADRLTKEHGIPTKPEDIDVEDLVFRVMTDEHIPRVPKKKSKAALAKEAKKAKSDAIFNELLDDDEEEQLDIKDPNVELVPMKVNFPPFKHYRLFDFEKHGIAKPENGKPYDLVLVGKSHWKGDLENGHFSKDHGKTTDNLAMMYMKLCERYATRSNWRNYTYNDEMKSQALLQLAQVGLQFNEAKYDNPFAYYTTTVTHSFTRVLNTEKNLQKIRDDILEANGLTPSWTRQLENEISNKDNHDS